MVGKVCFPQPWSELSDACIRMPANTLQDINEVVVWIDIVQATGRDQTLHD